MDAGILAVATLVALGACVIVVVATRRRAERRAAAARERRRARRRRVPAVSANVRGLPAAEQDLWRRESEAASRDGRTV